MSTNASELTALKRIRRLGRVSFEDAIAEIYRGEGYLVERAARGSADRGYDLVLLRESSVLVQCKHWLVEQVGVAPVRKLAEAMQKVGATGGVIVTTGTFTKRARELAIGMAIELVDGGALVRRFSGMPAHTGRQLNVA
jgi:restriction system protein